MLPKFPLVLLSGLFLILVCSQCARKDAANIQRAAQSVVSPSPNQHASPIVADKYEFNRKRTEVLRSSGTKLVERELREENSELKFEDDVSFPQFDPPTTSSQSRFNDAVKQLASKKFESYKRDQLRPRSSAERFPRYHEDVVEFLRVDYDLPFVTDRFVNVRFYASTYGRGAGHAVDYFFVFNFDLQSSSEIELAGLFSPGSKYLRLISDYSRQTVKERICREGGWAGTESLDDCFKDGPLWEDGVKPTSENFKAWTITTEGLLFSFDPCQLTGCSSGEFYVVVPYSQLSAMIRPNSVIPPT
jgi:hypothetical protein